MAFPMARTAGDRAQQDPLRGFDQIVTKALNQSGLERNNATPIHEAIETIQRNEIYRDLLTTNRSATNSYNCLLTAINSPALPLPPLRPVVVTLSDQPAQAVPQFVVPRFEPDWITWGIMQAAAVVTAVRNGAVAGGTLVYDSVHNLWAQEGVTPEERQEIAAVLEEQLGKIEEKKV